MQRWQAATLSADVVGTSRLMQVHERGRTALRRAGRKV